MTSVDVLDLIRSELRDFQSSLSLEVVAVEDVFGQHVYVVLRSLVERELVLKAKLGTVTMGGTVTLSPCRTVEQLGDI